MSSINDTIKKFFNKKNAELKQDYDNTTQNRNNMPQDIQAFCSANPYMSELAIELYAQKFEQALEEAMNELANSPEISDLIEIKDMMESKDVSLLQKLSVLAKSDFADDLNAKHLLQILESDPSKESAIDKLTRERIDALYEELMLEESLNAMRKATKKVSDEVLKFMQKVKPLYKHLHDNNTKNLPSTFAGMEKGEWGKTVDLEVVTKIAREMAKRPTIKKIAAELGRVKDAIVKEEKESIEFVQPKFYTDIDDKSKTDIKGIEFTDDIPSAIPQELALSQLAPELFAKKFIDKELISHEQIDKVLKSDDIVTLHERTVQRKYVDKGPIIICVDTSGSMSGEPETLAKSVLLAIQTIITNEERDCFLISFSTDIEVIDLSDINVSMKTVFEFISKGFNGGTDPDPALVYALALLKDNPKYKYADVLFISDFMLSFSDKIVKSIAKQQKDNGTRFVGLIIGEESNDGLKMFDKTLVYKRGALVEIPKNNK